MSACKLLFHNANGAYRKYSRTRTHCSCIVRRTVRGKALTDTRKREKSLPPPTGAASQRQRRSASGRLIESEICFELFDAETHTKGCDAPHLRQVGMFLTHTLALTPLIILHCACFLIIMQRVCVTVPVAIYNLQKFHL